MSNRNDAEKAMFEHAIEHGYCNTETCPIHKRLLSAVKLIYLADEQQQINEDTLSTVDPFQDACLTAMKLAEFAEGTGDGGQPVFSAVVHLVFQANFEVKPRNRLALIKSAIDVAYMARTAVRGFDEDKATACQRVIEALVTLHYNA